jgi:hypothetical protein
MPLTPCPTTPCHCVHDYFGNEQSLYGGSGFCVCEKTSSPLWHTAQLNAGLFQPRYHSNLILLIFRVLEALKRCCSLSCVIYLDLSSSTFVDSPRICEESTQPCEKGPHLCVKFTQYCVESTPFCVFCVEYPYFCVECSHFCVTFTHTQKASVRLSELCTIYIRDHLGLIVLFSFMYNSTPVQATLVSLHNKARSAVVTDH